MDTESNKLLKTSKESTDKERRSDWEGNHVLIREAYLRLIRAHRRRPTLAEISEETGISTDTVSAHLKQLTFSPSKSSLRVLTDDVLMSIFEAAVVHKKVPAQKLWLQVMEGWEEKTSSDLPDELKQPVINILKTYAAANAKAAKEAPEGLKAKEESNE